MPWTTLDSTESRGDEVVLLGDEADAAAQRALGGGRAGADALAEQRDLAREPA